MQVLVLTADLPPQVHSGVGTAVAWSTQALAGTDCSVEVLTTAANAYMPGVNITQLNTQSFPNRLRGASVIHLHSLRLADLAWELRQRDGSALLYTAHALLESELEMTWSSRPWRAKQMRLFEQADHVIFLSEVERSAAITHCPRVAGCSTVLPNAIAAAPTEHARRVGPPLVLFAGRICWSKGADVAAASMGSLLGQYAEACCALLGYKGEPLFATLVQDLVKCYPGRFFVRGWLSQPELQAWFARASLLLMPSRYEPFGMVALEALRMGVPVLGAEIDGLRDLLVEDSGASTIGSHDPNEWANTAMALLDDSERLQQRRACGPRFVQAHYGLEEHARRYLSVLRQCHAARAPRAYTQGARTPAAQRAA